MSTKLDKLYSLLDFDFSIHIKYDKKLPQAFDEMKSNRIILDRGIHNHFKNRAKLKVLRDNIYELYAIFDSLPNYECTSETCKDVDYLKWDMSRRLNDIAREFNEIGKNYKLKVDKV